MYTYDADFELIGVPIVTFQQQVVHDQLRSQELSISVQVRFEDVGREMSQVERVLPDYLQRETRQNEKHVGIKSELNSYFSWGSHQPKQSLVSVYETKTSQFLSKPFKSNFLLTFLL